MQAAQYTDDELEKIVRDLCGELQECRDYEQGVKEAVAVTPSISCGEILLPQMEAELRHAHENVESKKLQLHPYLFEFFKRKAKTQVYVPLGNVSTQSQDGWVDTLCHFT